MSVFVLAVLSPYLWSIFCCLQYCDTDSLNMISLVLVCVRVQHMHVSVCMCVCERE